MSLEFNHKVGQNGNQLFVCLKAALVARKHDLSISMPSNGLVSFREQPVPARGGGAESRIPVNGNEETLDHEKHYVLRRGYYQDVAHYKDHKDIITNEILDLPVLEKRPSDEVVVHVRLDGFNHSGHNSHIIHPRWYEKILDSLSFSKLYIVMDTKSGRIWRRQKNGKNEYLKYFERFDPVVVSDDARKDFEFIRSFDTIVSSNSTFCFWAAFLSEASCVYMPPFWESRRARLSDIQNAKIIEEGYGYVNVDNMEEVKITFQ